MKNLLPTSLVTLLILGLYAQVKAEIPQPPKFEDYANLLKRSPFTIKKVNKVVESVVEPKKVTSYVLRGVTKLDDKWTATIVDKKAPKVNINLRQGDQNKSGLKLMDVAQSKTNYRETTVTILDGGDSQTVGYRLDELEAKPTAPARNTSDRERTSRTREAESKKYAARIAEARKRSSGSGEAGNPGLLPDLDENSGDDEETKEIPRRRRPIIIRRK